MDAVTRVDPKTGLPKREIGDEVMMAAAKARVAVEIGLRTAA